MWRGKLALAGLLVAAFSLLAAREYLRAPPARTRPGLDLTADPEPPPPPRGRHATVVGVLFAALALLGIVLAAWSLLAQGGKR